MKCVYAGSSGEGRGLDLIINIAREISEINFIIIGQFQESQRKNYPKNIFFCGKKSHLETIYIMSLSDIGLMPYQNKLSLGKFSINSIDWMSPLKMFDYMNSNLLILSSYHKVLEEILIDGLNCIFIKDFENYKSWANCLKKINKEKIQNLGKNAKQIFEDKYTYEIRTKKILKNIF